MHDQTSARTPLQRALAIRIKLFGEEHESTADNYREPGVAQNNMHTSIVQSHQRWPLVLNCVKTNMKALLTATGNSI